MRTTPDGSATVYRWDVFGRLERIERHGDDGDVIGVVPVAYDALDRPVVVDGRAVDYDPVSGLADDDPWLPGGERPLGGTAVGDVWIVGARVLDPDTHQFLSTDPLLPVPGSHGAASGYTYCWNDPVNWVDPTGMRPLSTEEFAAVMSAAEQTALGQAWDAVREDPWGTLGDGRRHRPRRGPLRHGCRHRRRRRHPHRRRCVRRHRARHGHVQPADGRRQRRRRRAVRRRRRCA